MNALIWLAVVSTVISLVLTPVFRSLFRAWGVVDVPDEDRKIHGAAIPRGGGTAIAVSYVLAFLIVQWRTGIVDEHLALALKVLPAACTIFAVGLIDDIWNLRAWQKLLGQGVAAGVACWSGILAVDLVGFHGREWWTIPVTVIWLLACSNAFNLVDGMDGLAAGVGIFATLTIVIAALMQKNIALAMATVPLAGCLLGFLRYNFNPATVFLGDSGSLLIGFLLGCYGIIWTEKSATLLGMTAPLMVLPSSGVSCGISRFSRQTGDIFTIGSWTGACLPGRPLSCSMASVVWSQFFRCCRRSFTITPFRASLFWCSAPSPGLASDIWNTPNLRSLERCFSAADCNER